MYDYVLNTQDFVTLFGNTARRIAPIIETNEGEMQTQINPIFPHRIVDTTLPLKDHYNIHLRILGMNGRNAWGPCVERCVHTLHGMYYM